MKKRWSVLLGISAGAALVSLIDRRQREANAREWQKNRPGTALITGASVGIGEEFARVLARRGYNLVLVARRTEKLRVLADELQRQHPVKVDVMTADLSDPVDIERAAARIGEIPDLDLLVNNAGFGTGGRFDTTQIQTQLKMVRLHVEASERLMHAALRVMVPRGHGAVINVASLGGFLPMPGSATYGATKAYLIAFSKAVDLELRGTGVRVQALCPGFTYSEFHEVAGVVRSRIPGLLWMPAGPVVAESLRGLEDGQVVVVPGWINQLIAAVTSSPLIMPLIRLARSLPFVWRRFGME